jgi:hypothetical protein
MLHDALVSYVTGVVILLAGTTLTKPAGLGWLQTLFVIAIWPLSVVVGVMVNLYRNVHVR